MLGRPTTDRLLQKEGVKEIATGADGHMLGKQQPELQNRAGLLSLPDMEKGSLISEEGPTLWTAMRSYLGHLI